MAARGELGALAGRNITLTGRTTWSANNPCMQYAPFVTGVLLACLNQPSQARASSLGHPLPGRTVWLLWALVLACASFPFAHSAHDMWIVGQAMASVGSWLMVGEMFWYTLGATCLVQLALALGACRDTLHTRLAQWLGRISFGLYLTHIPLLYTLNCDLFLAGLAWGLPYAVGALAACATSWAVMLMAAELFTRFVDEPAIRWSARAGRWLLGDA